MHRIITVWIVLIISCSIAHGATHDEAMTSRLLVYIASGSAVRETTYGYLIETPHGLIHARRMAYGWLLSSAGSFPGARVRRIANGWVATMKGKATVYRVTANGFDASPGPILRADPAEPSLQPSGIEALYHR